MAPLFLLPFQLLCLHRKVEVELFLQLRKLLQKRKAGGATEELLVDGEPDLTADYQVQLRWKALVKKLVPAQLRSEPAQVPRYQLAQVGALQNQIAAKPLQELHAVFAQVADERVRFEFEVVRFSGDLGVTQLFARVGVELFFLAVNLNADFVVPDVALGTLQV